jgi:hypothetical protein
MLFFIYHEYQDWMSFDIQSEETKETIYSLCILFFFVKKIFLKKSIEENFRHLEMITMQMSIA